MANGSLFQGGPETSRRRSQRVILSLPVTIRTEGGPKDASFEEETHTLVVNLHGALIVLAGKVTKGQQLRLMNRATREEQMCRVATVGLPTGGKAQIGVEFLKPSPDFWHISFPPEDWVLPEPSSLSSDKG
jgi:PilZ domain-containing protein